MGKKKVREVIFVFLALVLVCASQAAGAATRQDVYALLNGIQGNWNGVSLRVSLNNMSKDPVVVVGDEVRYRLEASQPGHFVLMHVDSHGTATLIRPKAQAGSGSQPLSEYTFPPDGLLTAEPPLGKETVYAVLTERPVTNEAFGLSGDRDFIQSDDSVALARTFRDVITGVAGTSKVAVAKLEYQVEGAPGTTEYTTRAIKRVFADEGDEAATQSTVGKSLPARIRFEFGSAVLTPEGRINLDTFGEALLDRGMSDQIYELAGHTDDIGDEPYNKALSIERARSAQRYLVDNFGIAPSRLEIRGYGETRPLQPNTDERARAMNRRVEFIRTR